MISIGYINEVWQPSDWKSSSSVEVYTVNHYSIPLHQCSLWLILGRPLMQDRRNPLQSLLHLFFDWGSFHVGRISSLLLCFWKWGDLKTKAVSWKCRSRAIGFKECYSRKKTVENSTVTRDNPVRSSVCTASYDFIHRNEIVGEQKSMYSLFQKSLTNEVLSILEVFTIWMP